MDTAPPLPPPPPAQAGGSLSTLPEDESDLGVWAEGCDLYMLDGAEGPPRCVKCNAPGTQRWSKALVWHDPMLYFTIFAGALLYVILALALRSKARVTLSLCPEHAARRRRRILVGWLVFALWPVLWGVAFALQHEGSRERLWSQLFLGGFLALFAGMTILHFGSRVVTPRRIQYGVLRLKGAGVDFLESLPQRSDRA